VPRLVLPTLLVVALHAAVAAQEAIDRTPVLDLRTSSSELALFVHGLCDSAAAPPAIGADDGSYRVLVTVDGDVHFTIEVSRAAPCQLKMRPDQVWANLTDGHGLVTWGFRTVMAMELRQRGVPTWQMNPVLRALRDFPDQLSELELSLTGDPGDRIVLDVSLEPTPGSWLDGVITGLEPAPLGAPRLRDPDAFVALSCAVRGDGVRDLLAPLVEQIAHCYAEDAEHGARLTECAMQRIATWDGTLALLSRSDGSWLRLIGLRDEQEFEELSESDLGKTLDEDQRAVEGQDVAVIESGYSLTAHAPGDDADLLRWSDRVREGRHKPWPLGGGALIEGELHFGNAPAGLVEGTTFRFGGTQVDLDDEKLGWLRDLRQRLPQFALFSLKRQDHRLHFHAESR